MSRTKKTKNEQQDNTHGQVQTAELGNGLEKLSEEAKKLKLGLFKFQLPSSSSSLTRAEITAEAETIKGSVPSALKVIMDDDNELAECKTSLDRKIVNRKNEAQVTAAQDYLKYVLSLKGGMYDEIYRGVAAGSYIETVVRQQFRDYDHARAVLAELVERGLLVQDSEGQILIAYQHYRLGSFELDAENKDKTTAAIDKFSRGLMALENERRQKQKKSMEEDAEIDLSDAENGKDGMCMVHVQSEPQLDKEGNQRVDEKTGKQLWHPGGNMLVDFRGEYVYPMKASGAIERTVTQLAEMKIRLRRDTLCQENPPGKGGKGEDGWKVFRSFVTDVQRYYKCSWEDAMELAKKAQRFWYMMQNGIEGYKDEKAQAEIKALLSSKAEITALQLLGLNGSAGQPVKGKLGFLEFKSAFRQKNGSRVYNPFFLAMMEDGEDGKDFLKVVEIPPHLQGFLGQYVGNKYPASDNYRSCPFGQLMRAIRGQEEMAIVNAK